MANGSIARRWAKALFLLAEQENRLLVVSREIDRVAEAWVSSQDLQSAMANPMLDRKIRSTILGEVLKALAVSKTMENFVRLLNDKHRIGELAGIARAFQLLADQKENRIRAEVISAVPLDDTVVASIQAAIEAATRKKVLITRREDSSLIGGVVTRVGDLMYDGSIRTQLNRIKEGMLGG
ncbi:MAG: ATP synthase F1 subunit delta [Deltaproteobacteria bacterium]|nr:ATP synthase F1 subunit delta [Deltaproteobacteria bacterium]